MNIFSLGNSLRSINEKIFCVGSILAQIIEGIVDPSKFFISLLLCFVVLIVSKLELLCHNYGGSQHRTLK